MWGRTRFLPWKSRKNLRRESDAQGEPRLRRHDVHIAEPGVIPALI